MVIYNSLGYVFAVLRSHQGERVGQGTSDRDSRAAAERAKGGEKKPKKEEKATGKQRAHQRGGKNREGAGDSTFTKAGRGQARCGGERENRKEGQEA